MPAITFDPGDDQYRMLSEITQKYGGDIESGLQQMIVEPISRAYFLAFTAPQDYYAVTSEVTLEEAENARIFVTAHLELMPAKLRPEVLLFGLLLTAIERANIICAQAGYKHPTQHGENLAQVILTQSAATIRQMD